MEWLNRGQFPNNMNDSKIVLILKVENPNSMKYFTPIALCNVLYKILAKVLANRLKNILPSIIDELQAAFVPGRSITNNVIVGFEIIHHMKTRRHGGIGEGAPKLDINKAYDRQIMQVMGFDDRWVNWIMLYISIVKYSIGVNGELVGPVIPKRGLRQGDPFSPYFFIICSEGLFALLRQAENRGHIHGSRICR